MKSTIFAGAVTAPKGGLFRCGPGQEGWERIGTGLPEQVKVYCITAVPGDPRTLYLGAAEGVFCSTDGGPGALRPAQQRLTGTRCAARRRGGRG